MRGLGSGAAALAVLILLAGCNQDNDDVGAADDATETPGAPIGPPPPKRTLGQWEHKVTIYGETRTMRICLDERTEKLASWWNTASNPTDCSKQEFNRQPDGTWTFYTVCRTRMGGESASSGAATGDFSKSYTVMSTTTTQGSSNPQVNGVLDTRVEATYLGPCPAGQRGGDVTLPNGQIRNLFE
ncbi:MAG: hypothetical protein KF842_07935 [Caulobacter sp.]|nr:hypothetical protein [Caulobacter sp.]